MNLLKSLKGYSGCLIPLLFLVGGGFWYFSSFPDYTQKNVEDAGLAKERQRIVAKYEESLYPKFSKTLSIKHQIPEAVITRLKEFVYAPSPCENIYSVTNHADLVAIEKEIDDDSPEKLIGELSAKYNVPAAAIAAALFDICLYGHVADHSNQGD